jgi:hypothetical protein
MLFFVCRRYQSLKDKIESYHNSAIKPIVAAGHALVAKSNPHAERITACVEWLGSLWTTLLGLHTARQDALKNALSLHRYAAEAAEGTTWLTQKEECVCPSSLHHTRALFWIA